jgi:hypothetical protein
VAICSVASTCPRCSGSKATFPLIAPTRPAGLRIARWS